MRKERERNLREYGRKRHDRPVWPKKKSRRRAARKRNASREAEARRKEKEEDESSCRQRMYFTFHCSLHPTI